MGNSTPTTDNAGGAEDVRLYTEIRPEQWPIIYSPEYDISFAGLERLHPFDSCKWSKVYRFLLGGSELYAAQYIASSCDINRHSFQIHMHVTTFKQHIVSRERVFIAIPLRFRHGNEGYDN